MFLFRSEGFATPAKASTACLGVEDADAATVLPRHGRALESFQQRSHALWQAGNNYDNEYRSPSEEQ